MTKFNKLHALQHFTLVLHLSQYVLLVVLYAQIDNYRKDFPQLADRVENQLRAIESPNNPDEWFFGELLEVDFASVRIDI